MKIRELIIYSDGTKEIIERDLTDLEIEAIKGDGINVFQG